MNIIAILLVLAALICFLLATFGAATRWNLVAGGLALLTLYLLFTLLSVAGGLLKTYQSWSIRIRRSSGCLATRIRSSPGAGRLSSPTGRSTGGYSITLCSILAY